MWTCKYQKQQDLCNALLIIPIKDFVWCFVVIKIYYLSISYCGSEVPKDARSCLFVPLAAWLCRIAHCRWCSALLYIHFKTIAKWWTQERNWVPRLLPQFLVVSSFATHIHTYTQAEGKEEIRSHWQKNEKKKKMSHECNWMCGWFVVFQCCFNCYFMLLELKSPRDTNNFSFQFIRPLFFSYFFAGVGLGWAERGHFLLLVTFTLGLPPLPPHRVTWVKAMESCVASTSNCSSPKWSFTSKWVVLTYNASGSRVARYGAVF